jgi:hypothetical protein
MTKVNSKLHSERLWTKRTAAGNHPFKNLAVLLLNKALNFVSSSVLENSSLIQNHQIQ